MTLNWMDLKLHQLLMQTRAADPVGTKLGMMLIMVDLVGQVTVATTKVVVGLVAVVTAKGMVDPVKEAAVTSKEVVVATTMGMAIVGIGLACTPTALPF